MKRTTQTVAKYDNGRKAGEYRAEVPPDPDRPMIHQIRVRGHLGREWADWFGGLAVTREADGDALLAGPVVDQAALHALLKKIRDLGLTLLSVNRVEPDPPPAPGPGQPKLDW
jgi:hypothetical protein